LAIGLALKSDGAVIALGERRGATNVPVGLSNVVAIAAGSSSSFAIKKDSTTRLSGIYTNGATAFSNAAAGAIDSAGFQGAVLPGDGTASVWGFPATNVTIVSNVTAVASACPFNQTGADPNPPASQRFYRVRAEP
jgi:hypothetical protein